MTTSTTTSEAPPARRPRPRPLSVRVGLTLAVAVVGNLALSQALAAATDADRDFVGLQPVPVAVASITGVLLGTAAYLVLRRLGRPRWFVPLVAAGALLSLGGPLSLLSATQAEPGVTDAAALALIPLHLLVAVVVAVVLPRRTR